MTSSLMRPVPARVAGVLLAAALLTALPAGAHSGRHDRQAAIDAALAQNPRDARLYLKRGELHRAHQAWLEALADFRRAERLDPSLVEVEHSRARLWLEAGQPEVALRYAERFLAAWPHHVSGLVLRGRALAGVGRLPEAIESLTLALQRSVAPAPDDFLEIAELQAALGQLPDALASVEAGLARLGQPVGLVERAVALELRLGRSGSALRRLEALPRALQEAPEWQLTRAEALFLAGRPEEAWAACNAARRWLEGLPASRRKHYQAVEERLHRLEAGGEPTVVVRR